MTCSHRCRVGVIQTRVLKFVMGFLAATFASIAVEANAQESATGTINGRVLNTNNGQYVNKALVTVEGTRLEALTDDFGNYELRNVPAGQVQLKVSSSGLAAQTVPATVTAGATTTKDLRVGKAAGDNGTLMLDPFEVQSERFRNAREIALNEERQSVTIKNVVAADAYGSIPNGNVGEFVKFLPGVQISYGAFNGNNQGYSDTDASGISVRGFGPEDTTILIDGLPVTNATPGSLSRQVGLDMLSINNASRVELIKVTPADMPSNSPGGQVNLITKSAFEYAKPSYSARVFLNLNSENTSFNETVGPTNKKTFKTTPGLEFSATYPISRKFGLSFTGFSNREFNQTYRAQPTYTISGTVVNSAGNTVGLNNPILSRYQITDSPRITDRISANVRADWKPTASQTINLNFQYSTYTSSEAQRRLDFRPIITTGVDWTGTSTTGTTANSTDDMTVTTRDKVGYTASSQLHYKLQWRGWAVTAAANYSVSRGDFRDSQNGHFSEVNFKLNPGQVVFQNIENGHPDKILTFARTTNGGGPLDYTNFANFGFDGQTAKSGQASSKYTNGIYRVDVERQLDFIPWLESNAMTFQTGFRRDQDKQEKWGRGTGYADVLDTGKTYNVADVLDTDYKGQSPGFGLPAQQWGSTYKLYQLNQTQHLFVAPADGTSGITNNWNSYQGQQKSITTTTDGYYGELSGRFFKNRLSFLGGVRFEEKTNKGRGPFTDSKWNYIKNADGTLYEDSVYQSGVKTDGTTTLKYTPDGNGGYTSTSISSFNFLTADPALISRLNAAGVKYPDHILGPVGTSLESDMLNRVANKPINAKAKSDPSYSLSLAYDITKKLRAQFGWSRAMRLPALEDGQNGVLSGNGVFTINENSPIPADGTVGTIKVANPGLKPELSNNLDYKLSYYTDNGGVFSAGYYTKTVSNQIVTFTSYSGSADFNAILPALGLAPADYDGWQLQSSSNGTTKQKTSGWEFEVRQDFRFLGERWRNLSVFGSYTEKTLGDAPVVAPYTIMPPNGTTPVSVTPAVRTITLSANRFAGWGVQYAGRRFSVQAKGTYRNDNETTGRVTLTGGNFLRQIQPAEVRWDLNMDFQLTRQYSLFISGRDVFNASRKVVARDDFHQYPSYFSTVDLKEFGTEWSFGVSGHW